MFKSDTAAPLHRPWRLRAWVWFWSLAALALPASCVIASWSICSSVNESVKNIEEAHAVELTAELIIKHMETNQGRWPSCWEDLPRVGSVRPDVVIDLQKRVAVNWSADPRKLAQAKAVTDHPPFRVVWLKNGSPVHFEDGEPNQMILDYLRREANPN
ncbi:MAG: hypothetical protein RIC55_11860 [Pirellulaceae bacterium]